MAGFPGSRLHWKTASRGLGSLGPSLGPGLISMEVDRCLMSATTLSLGFNMFQWVSTGFLNDLKCCLSLNLASWWWISPDSHQFLRDGVQHAYVCRCKRSTFTSQYGTKTLLRVHGWFMMAQPPLAFLVGRCEELEPLRMKLQHSQEKARKNTEVDTSHGRWRMLTLGVDENNWPKLSNPSHATMSIHFQSFEDWKLLGTNILWFSQYYWSLLVLTGDKV